MVYLINITKEIFHHLRQYKTRTFMTMFGLIWGTITVILLLAFGTGLGKKLMVDMHGMGEGIAIVWPGSTSIPYKGYGRDRQIRLRAEDVELIRREVPGLAAISPEFSSWNAPVRRGNKVNTPNISGVLPEYAGMRNIGAQPGGRWLNDLDIKNRRRVVFLGDKLKEFLFGNETDAVGQYVYVGDAPFQVIGVLIPKSQDSSYNSRDCDRAYIPYTTFTSIFGSKFVSNIVYQHKDPRHGKANERKVYEVLAKKFTFDPNDQETLGIWDTYENEMFMVNFNTAFTVFMGIIGAISLLVGGIGLANIMYVVVQERTKEIGIRRSIGAKKRHIMGQIFLETMIVIFSSALIGFFVSWGLIILLNMFPIQGAVGSPQLSIPVAVITITILSLIGFTAGFFPARKASNMDPVDCLRY